MLAVVVHGDFQITCRRQATGRCEAMACGGAEVLCDRQWARLQAVVALEPYRPALSVHTGEGGVRWQVDWRSALAAAAAAVGMTLIGTTFSPRVTATPPEEMAIAVSGVVRRLDI